MKACRDCKFFGYWDPVCLKPEFQRETPIEGSMPEWAVVVRSRAGKCGPEAHGFEPKPKDNSRLIERVLFWAFVLPLFAAAAWSLSHG